MIVKCAIMKRFCFTLIELLVVIAMITLLLTIIIFVLRSIRQQARTLVCSSHIRQVTLDLIMYDTDNETFPFSFLDQFDPPPPGGRVGSPSRDMVGWWWFHLMEGYTDTKKKNLYCPSKLLDNPRLQSSILYGNHGVNRSICKDASIIPGQKEFYGAPLCKDEIPQPSRTLLIVDCGYSITSWWHATDILPVSLDGSRGMGTAYIPGLKINKDKYLLPGQERDAIEGRHPNKKVNVGFVGANVSRMRADELFVEKRIGGYKNKIPFWSPE